MGWGGVLRFTVEYDTRVCIIRRGWGNRVNLPEDDDCDITVLDIG